MKIIYLLLIYCLCQSSFSEEKIYRFGIVTKDSNIPFFKSIKKGCLRRAKELKNVECLFAEMKAGNSHLQEQAIKDLVSKKVDGIAIAIINSEFTKRSIENYIPKHIPVVTIDADFSKEVLKPNPKIRVSYIGTNNYVLGYELAKLFVDESLEANEFCIISGHRYSFNLNERIRGFMSYIKKSSKDKYVSNKRCPLYSLESSDKALSHLVRSLSFKTHDGKPLTVAVMGAWPQTNLKDYIKLTSHVSKKLNTKVNVFAIDTTSSQIELLKRGHSLGNVGQRPEQMGEMAIEILLDINKGKKVEEVNFTGVTKCTPKNYQSCLK
ncbi:hypothetical protein A9Q84_02470 [Halobacteriovorax marinus]|uniref:Periplasmic binding protein domain-containing protein n=1 Tax=Halobacteriovorax marinus TaxID=97084 RepID=A0A1Y5FIA1_9BACT|nr:hypothetical protein A9Q84_02470 [Halobacteriovorax marinus]